MNNLLRQLIDPTRKMALATVSIVRPGAAAIDAGHLLRLLHLPRRRNLCRRLRNGSRKLAGDLGERMLKLAEGTVTGVMVGIVGTAAAQAWSP
jgi:hypothetical protein